MTGDMEKRSILIADDDDGLTEMLCETFRGNNYIVYDARSGMAAVEIFNQYRPQITLLDVSISGNADLEVVKTIRRTDSFTPIVVYADCPVDEKGSLECYRSGVNLFLRKPIASNELFACINNVMDMTYGAGNEVVQIGNFRWNNASHTLMHNRGNCKLNDREARTLKLLFKNNGRLVTMSELSIYVLRCPMDESGVQMLRNTITELKKKIRIDPSVTVNSVYSKGYILEIFGTPQNSDGN